MEELFMKRRVATIRKDIRVPEQLVEQVEEYQVEQGIATWTAAALELVRKGLNEHKKE